MLLTELIELHSSHDVYLVGLGGEGRFSSDAIDNVFVGVMYLDLVWSVWCLQIHSLLAAMPLSSLSLFFGLDALRPKPLKTTYHNRRTTDLPRWTFPKTKNL